MIPAPPELLLVVALGVFLFGARLIPQWANALGKSIEELRNAQKRAELEAELDGTGDK